MKWILGSIFAVALIFASYWFSYLGLWKSVSISVGETPAISILYREHIGPYHKIAELISEVENQVRSMGLSCKLTFGEYLDDPGLVEEIRLRSRGGCLLERSEENPSLVEKAKSMGLQFAEIPARKAIFAEFDGAPSAGPLKVYPEVQKFAETQKFRLIGPTMEVYEVLSPKKVKTSYYFPIAP